MPIPENYQPKHWFQTPEPCCRPGYTGYLPEYGPKRLYQFGETYGHMTHNLMKSHPVAGLRMGNIVDFNKELQEKLEEEAIVWKHEVTSENNRFRAKMVPGYTGFVPRRGFLFGKVYDEECKQAVALIEKQKLIKENASQ
ncbi:hypothetical protein AVEN_257451-1 [Araneus ventricosus]|uniref:Ciliary microtubule inner protein 2A-C-like domain-containing protein n=1 Tax=Araneus ventricosus TaxID=182803 RepID=A0A4Y2FDP6_ARAVE|nr:hypothetical protein AVEN_257451-1 [Araneus ventricosus]